VVECTRVVLVIQCFAVGVDLPKHYMKRHWKDILFLLVPVMVWSWMISSLLIWFMVTGLTWKQSLAYAAYFNAIEPVLTATVVGNAKFAKTVPAHLRRMLLAESACNGLTTSLALGSSTQILLYEASLSEIFYRFLVLTTLYEVVFGAVLGCVIGLVAQLAMRRAEQRSMIDRSSFLSFYLVLSLFCVGVGSMLGVDGVLPAFAIITTIRYRGVGSVGSAVVGQLVPLVVW
jgi:sodium/hydrogen antiporter